MCVSPHKYALSASYSHSIKPVTITFVVQQCEVHDSSFERELLNASPPFGDELARRSAHGAASSRSQISP